MCLRNAAEIKQINLFENILQSTKHWINELHTISLTLGIIHRPKQGGDFIKWWYEES